MQYHEESGVHHFVSGATCEYNFYQGLDSSKILKWIDKSGATGFLSASAYHDRIVFQFVGAAAVMATAEARGVGDSCSYNIVKEVVVIQ